MLSLRQIVLGLKENPCVDHAYVFMENHQAKTEKCKYEHRFFLWVYRDITYVNIPVSSQNMKTLTPFSQGSPIPRWIPGIVYIIILKSPWIKYRPHNSEKPPRHCKLRIRNGWGGRLPFYVWWARFFALPNHMDDGTYSIIFIFNEFDQPSPFLIPHSFSISCS